MNNNKMKAPFITSIIGSVLMLVCWFLPFWTADAESVGDKYANVSWLQYLQAYKEVDDMFGTAASSMVVYVMYGIFGACAICMLVTFILAVTKKAIAVLVFAIISFFEIIRIGQFVDAPYSLSIGAYLMYLGVVLTAAGAIWMIVVRRQIKASPTETTV